MSAGLPSRHRRSRHAARVKVGLQHALHAVDHVVEAQAIEHIRAAQRAGKSRDGLAGFECIERPARFEQDGCAVFHHNEAESAVFHREFGGIPVAPGVARLRLVVELVVVVPTAYFGL